MIRKRENDNLDFIKMKNTCSVKAQWKMMRRQVTKWERKYLQTALSDKSLVSGIYKELSDLKDDKQSN